MDQNVHAKTRREGPQTYAALLFGCSGSSRSWKARSGVNAQGVINAYPIRIEELNFDWDDLARIPEQIANAHCRVLATERLRTARAEEMSGLS